MRNKVFTKGFTLIEILIVIAILSILAGIVAPISFDMYTRFSIESERKLFVASLREARNSAYANINAQNHGLFINDESYIIYEGDNFISRIESSDYKIRRDSNIIIEGQNDTVFARGTGFTNDASFIFNAYGTTSIIIVTKYGSVEIQ